MPLLIYDGNNHFRKRAEVSMSPLRELYEQVQASVDPQIYVWDGPGALKARREIYPEYKADREPAAESIYESMRLFKKLLTLSKAVQISIPGYEADDVIAAIVKRYGSEKCFIFSNDADLWQLGAGMDRERPKIEPEWMRLYKATVGDPSDKIPGIKGFGKGAWDKCDKRGLLDFIVEGKPCNMEWMPKGSQTWLADETNLTLVRTFYKIVGFIEIPDDLIGPNTTVGIPKPREARQILNEFML